MWRELETMPYEHSQKDLGLLNWRKGGGFLVKSAIVKKLKEEGLNLFCITQSDRFRNNRTEGIWILVQAIQRGDELLHELLSALHR